MRATAEPRLRQYWYPVAFSSGVTDAPLGRRVLGTEIVVWRDADGRVACAGDRCPHRDAPLSRGWVTDGRVVCPYHGWQYGADGKCELIPQNAPGQRPSPRAVLPTYGATEALGLVWVCLEPESEPGAALAGIPEIAEFNVAGWRVVEEFDAVWPCSAAHLLDNNLDPAHIAFVHRATFGNPETPRVEKVEITRTGAGIRLVSRVPVYARPGETGATERRTTTDVCAPFTGVFHIRYPDGLSHIMVKAIAPIDDQSCRLLQFVVRNDTEADRPGADIVAFDSAVRDEDLYILETMPPDYHLDLTRNVHIDTDRGTIAYRRLLAEVTGGLFVAGREDASDGGAFAAGLDDAMAEG
jgi:phenylpropionate dioxygenase-like ring-hydroxylating dioxygenase large terminal subunit